MILDIHTHHQAPQPQGVISLRFQGECFELTEGQAYSIGIHPWDANIALSEKDWSNFLEIAQRPEIVAIGECGIDVSCKDIPMFRQLNLFKRQIEISEKLNKPMVIHDVKAHDMIIGLRKDLDPSNQWVIHGFRGKPQVMEMLLRSGCYISFGPLFNRDSLARMPQERILAETDESPCDISHVISQISEIKNKDMAEIIKINTLSFLKDS